MNKILKITTYVLAAVILPFTAVIGWGYWSTRAEVKNYRDQVISLAKRLEVRKYDDSGITSLPAPVQRYIQYTFPEGVPNWKYAVAEFAGEFRLPLKETFHPATAIQVTSLWDPSFVFDEYVTVWPGVWGHAMDAFIKGDMTMKAKVMSLFTTVNERSSQALNAVSLRRWLLESPVYPNVLLPGGVVFWEEINENSARATVRYQGIEATLRAIFRDDGSLEKFEAEEEGDLTISYHGSGEYVIRDAYRKVNGIMVPTRFEIGRRAGGKDFPFWKGVVKSITMK